jgi:uncharacterized protein YbjT (DUF2867 family)
MTVLVTGAAGVLGRHVCRLLALGGARVRAWEHHRAAPADAAERVQGDLLDAHALSLAVDGVDAVVHLAAVTHARAEGRYRRLNVEGTRRLAEAARAVERFVHVSSTANDPRGGWYSTSKRDAEEIVRAALPAAAIVRLPDVVGGGAEEGIDRVLRAAARGRRVPIVGRGDDVHRPIRVVDAAAAVVAALEHPGRTYTLAGPTVRMVDLVRAAGGRPLFVPVPLVRLACLASRALPLPVYPDQLQRLRSPKAPPDPAAWEELGIVPAPAIA